MSAPSGVVFKVADYPMLEMPNGLFRDSFLVTDTTGKGKGLSAGLVWFAPHNTEGHPDVHEFDEVFYVIAGEATFRAGGHEYQVVAGDVVYCAAGMEHTYLTAESGLQVFWCITTAWENMGQHLVDEIANTWHDVNPTTGWHTEVA